MSRTMNRSAAAAAGAAAIGATALFAFTSRDARYEAPTLIADHTAPIPTEADRPIAEATAAHAGPYVVDRPSCVPTAAYEHTSLTGSLVRGSGPETLQRVIWAKEGGPGGESYTYQAGDLEALPPTATVQVVDPADGTIGWFWSDLSGGPLATLNGFRTDPVRGSAMADALSEGTVPEGYVVSTGAIDTTRFHTWEMDCAVEAERYAVKVVQGAPEARAVYIAGSRHRRVVAETDTITVLQFGPEAPVRPARDGEWSALLGTAFPKDHR